MNLRASSPRSVGAIVGGAVAAIAAATLAVLWLTGAFAGEQSRAGPLALIGERAGFGTYQTWNECDVSVKHPSAMVREAWRTAVDTAVIACIDQGGFAAGALEFARFASVEALHAATRDSQPRRRRCTFDSTLVIEIIAPRFDEMCTAYGGRIDGQSP